MTLSSPEERADLVARLRNELVWPFTEEVADMLEADQRAIEALEGLLRSLITDGRLDDPEEIKRRLAAHRARLSDGADDD